MAIRFVGEAEPKKLFCICLFLYFFIPGVFFRKGDEESMFALGFITKHVEDLAPLTKIVAGDKADLLKLDRKVDMKDIKFYYMESSRDYAVSSMRSDLKNAMKR